MTDSPKSKGQKHVPTDDECKVAKAVKVKNQTGQTSDESRGIMHILLADEPKVDDMMIPPGGEDSNNSKPNQRQVPV